MYPFSCQRCGAALSVPDDLAAVTARCQFCGDQTPLPAQLLSARAQERAARAQAVMQQNVVAVQSQTQKTVGRTIAIVVAASLAVPVVIVAITFFAISRATSSIPPVEINVPTPAVAETAEKPPPDDPKSTGEERMTAMMKAADAAGCKTVIMPPDRAQGDRTLDTKFVVNGTCVRVMVATGMPDNKVTLGMKTPFGEPIKTPDPATEIDFIYCPKKDGPHPTSLSPATSGYYTVAALECPASVAAKKK